MIKVVFKKTPPGPRPTRDSLDLRGYSELSWSAACTLAEKERGNRVIVGLSVNYYTAHRGVPSEWLTMQDVRDVKHAMGVAKTFVQDGRAVVARVEGLAQRSYPGSRPVFWDLGGFRRVDFEDAIHALSSLPGGHDYISDNPHDGAPIASVAAKLEIKPAEAARLLRERPSLVTQLENGNWIATRYWIRELRVLLANECREAPTEASR